MPDFDDALFAFERHTIFPLAPKSKKPRKGDTWTRYAKSPLLLDDVRSLWGEQRADRLNIGIICTDCVGVDIDNREAANTLRERLPRSDMRTRSPNGGHIYFRKPKGLKLAPSVKTSILGIEADIRTGMSYLVAPGSVHPSGKLYERIGDWNWSNVPEFDPCWIEEAPRNTVHSNSQRIRDGLAYIATIYAVNGLGGHNSCFRVACKLCEAGMTELEVFAGLLEWNKTNAINPDGSSCPFTHRELMHKASDAFGKHMATANTLIAAQDNCRDGSCDIGGKMT